MRHSQTSRNFAKAFFAFVTIGLVSACSDTVVAPPATEVSFKAPAAFTISAGIKTFWVGSGGTTQQLGSHTIYMPAGSICEPLTSSYGSTEWDKPCTPIARYILITATMLEDAYGNPYVDFQPALRFVPTKEVSLFLKQGRSPKASEIKMNYCNNLGFCVDESIKDPSLAPRRLGRSSIIARRIKHFSGYSITAGEECQGTLTEDLTGALMCVTEELSLNKRSGYMVASGVAKKQTGKSIAKRFDQ